MECRQDLQVIIPELESCLEEIAAAGKQLSAHQHRRQQDIWMLVKVAVSSVCTLCGEVGGKNAWCPGDRALCIPEEFSPWETSLKLFLCCHFGCCDPRGSQCNLKGRCHYCVENFHGDWNAHVHACFMYALPLPPPPCPTHPHLTYMHAPYTHIYTCEHTHKNAEGGRERGTDKTMWLTYWPLLFLTCFNVSG